MSDDFCLGPPCVHFPSGTTREEASELLAFRTLTSATQVNYVSQRGSREAKLWARRQKRIDRFIDEEIGA